MHCFCMKDKNNELHEILATNVRVARAEQRISQEELAQRCGIHRNYISAIERGVCNVTIDTLWKLANGLKKKPFTLLRETSTD